MIWIYRVDTDPTTGEQTVEMSGVEDGTPVPEGWSTDYEAVRKQLPPDPVDPSQVLQAKMMAQIAALNKQVAELTGGAQ